MTKTMAEQHALTGQAQDYKNKQNKKPAFNSEHKPRKCNKRWVGVNEHYRTNRLKFSAKPQHKGSAWPQDWQLATKIVFSFHVTELYVKSIAHTLWDKKKKRPSEMSLLPRGNWVSIIGN